MSLDFFFSGSSFLPHSSVSASTSASLRPVDAFVRFARFTASAWSASFLLGAAMGDVVSLPWLQRGGEVRRVHWGGIVSG